MGTAAARVARQGTASGAAGARGRVRAEQGRGEVPAAGVAACGGAVMAGRWSGGRVVARRGKGGAARARERRRG